MNTPSTAVSPGIWGFLAFFVLAIALWLLMRNMNARMRRMSYRAEEARRRAEEQAGRPVGEGDGPTGPTGPKGGSPERPDDAAAGEDEDRRGG